MRSLPKELMEVQSRCVDVNLSHVVANRTTQLERFTDLLCRILLYLDLDVGVPMDSQRHRIFIFWIRRG